MFWFWFWFGDIRALKLYVRILWNNQRNHIWLFLKLSDHSKTLKITNTNNLFIITSMTPSISTRFQLHAVITSSCKSTISGERLLLLTFNFLFDPEPTTKWAKRKKSKSHLIDSVWYVMSLLLIVATWKNMLEQFMKGNDDLSVHNAAKDSL